MKTFLLLTLLTLLGGCGYHFPGQGGALPAGVEKLYVPLFINKTTEPQLENYLSSRVSEVFSRNKQVSLVESPNDADAVLEGVIRSYSSRALSYNQNDNISEYRSTMVVDASLRQVGTEQLLWQGSVSWQNQYAAADDKALQQDLERQAIDEITLRLAEDLLYKMLDDF